MTTQALIGLGSNLGPGRESLRQAWRRLGEKGDIVLLQLSSPYRTAPQDMATFHWFTNAVGVVETGMEALALLDRLLEIEAGLGRDRRRGRDRVIDLDLLAHGGETVDSPRLVLPHPELHRRLFVLVPLEEVAPDFVHPVLGETPARMIARLAPPDRGVIEKLRWISEEAWPA